VLVSLFGGGVAAQSDDDEPVRLPVRIAPERAEVDLVLVDVLVRDKKGNAIPGLSQEEFELRIDDRPASISTFEDYCASPVVSGRAAPESGEERETSPTQAVESPARHIVLFFDINQMSEKGRDRSIDASMTYVRERKRPQDLVMIVAMKGKPILLEDFTSDSDRLAARLAAMRSDPEMIDRHYLEERLNINDILARECFGVTAECVRRVSVAVPYAEEEMLRTQRSLEAIRDLMPALSAIPGRKTLVHFSESLRDEPGLQYLILAGSSPAWEGIDIRLLINQIHREANASGVSLYMVWAAGLGEKGAMGLADASRNLGPGDTIMLERALLGGEDAALSLGATLSLETGGVASQRTNDLGMAFNSVEQDLSCYYVLGYTNPGPGDGKRHMIRVKMARKGTRIRYRPYFEDWSDEERLEHRFQAALITPGYFDEIAVKVEAYALAPVKKKTPILVKVEFPVDAVTVVRQVDGVLFGQAEVRTKVWTDTIETCEFTRSIPITLELGEETSGRKVIYEAGCELPPGNHELSVAVLDSGTWDLGAASMSLPVRERPTGIAGDVVLWTSSGRDILVVSDAAGIGIHDTGSGHGFVPRSERRFGLRESGLLYVVVCPPMKGGQSDGERIEVRRKLFSGDTQVASYRDVILESGGRRSMCEGIFAPVPAGRLGPGGYIFAVQVEGIGEESITHRAGVAVSEMAPEHGGS
jgi:VWFA-related protein